MAAPFIPVVISAADALMPLLARLGLARWFNFAALRAVLSPIVLNAKTFAGWMWSIGFGSAKSKEFWGGAFAYLMYEIFGAAKDNIDDLFDEYGGDLKAWAFNMVNDIMCAGINAAIYDKFGVETNIVKLYPLNDPVVLENILYELGKVIAKLLNDRFGTNFASVFPVEQFVVAIKAQLITELTSGTRKILSNEDVASFIDGLNRIRSGELTEPYSHGGVVIVNPNSVDAIMAEKRYYNRLRQRKYRLTHERVSNAWKLKD